MLNNLPPVILLDVAILLTALAWGTGFYSASRRVYVFEPLAIGCFVCLIGYSVQSFGAPAWVIIAAPIPVDFLVLWYVMRRPRPMAIAYVSTWVVYIVLHIIMSVTLHYDSLIPAWRLHS